MKTFPPPYKGNQSLLFKPSAGNNRRVMSCEFFGGLATPSQAEWGDMNTRCVGYRAALLAGPWGVTTSPSGRAVLLQKVARRRSTRLTTRTISGTRFSLRTRFALLLVLLQEAALLTDSSSQKARALRSVFVLCAVGVSLMCMGCPSFFAHVAFILLDLTRSFSGVASLVAANAFAIGACSKGQYTRWLSLAVRLMCCVVPVPVPVCVCVCDNGDALGCQDRSGPAPTTPPAQAAVATASTNQPAQTTAALADNAHATAGGTASGTAGGVPASVTRGKRKIGDDCGCHDMVAGLGRSPQRQRTASGAVGVNPGCGGPQGCMCNRGGTKHSAADGAGCAVANSGAPMVCDSDDDDA